MVVFEGFPRKMPCLGWCHIMTSVNIPFVPWESHQMGYSLGADDENGGENGEGSYVIVTTVDGSEIR